MQSLSRWTVLRLGIAVLGLVSGWVALPAGQALAEEAGDPVAQAMTRAAAALEAGDATAAELSYREVLAREPGLVDAYRGLARALLAQGRRRESAEVLVPLGRGLMDAGRHDAAAEVLEEAATAVPSSAALQALWGKALLFARRQVAALPVLRRAVELGDREVTTRLFLAAALWDTRQFGDAEAVYRELIAGPASPTVAHHQLGRLLAWQGRYEEAVEHLRYAAARMPRAPDVPFDLAQALSRTGALDDALAYYRRALELNPRNYKARYGLARLLQRRGEREAAKTEMETYQRLYDEERQKTQREGLERARLDRGWELIEEGHLEEAIRHFSELGESVETLAAMATAASRLGDHARAVGYLERAVSFDPDRQDLRLMLDEERLAAGGQSE